MNKPLKFIVVKCDKARGNLVVSRRAILEKSRNEGLEKILSKIKVGDIVEGKCKAILDWGAFIDLDGADGLCHVTDLAYSRVKKTSDLLSVGQTMKFKVIKIDPETKRISLGIKQMFADPYEDLDKKYKELSFSGISFDSSKISADDLIKELKRIEDIENDISKSNKTWLIPVCYDFKYALDLENLAKEKNIPWRNIDFFFGDERCVNKNSKYSNIITPDKITELGLILFRLAYFGAVP